MPNDKNADKINIRPEVSILSVLRHLNYKPWFATAEFVDNALQSYIESHGLLESLHGKGFTLKVEIELDPAPPGRIVVRDNAAGIAERDYARAFKPAEPPSNRSGLSEFGMGMKSAACWFAVQWSVRTKALGEPIERTVAFDVADIVQNRIEELDIRTAKSNPNSHYTELILEGLHKIPQGRTVSKIKEHLASIYRIFLRSGTMALSFNGDPLTFQNPPILRALLQDPERGAGPLAQGDRLRFRGRAEGHGIRSPPGESLRLNCRVRPVSPQPPDPGKRR